MKRLHACENCGTMDSAMVFGSDRWCSDDCRKALVIQDAMEERVLDFNEATRRGSPLVDGEGDGGSHGLP